MDNHDLDIITKWIGILAIGACAIIHTRDHQNIWGVVYAAVMTLLAVRMATWDVGRLSETDDKPSAPVTYVPNTGGR